MHRATVSKHLTRSNVVRRQHGPTIEEAAEIVKLHGGGISMRAISRKMLMIAFQSNIDSTIAFSVP
ncbi:hypothetical protein [Leucobacter denitrificans]|uniref:Uncharacterized protein n=1 Tax=Leucobacter denitrificans TaxID=683042 RepID=A0A7G9S512_9MICO|nr:hypothetical protein [Leucobacter denitrificans]QNN62937.1 hypothetical protein H9L06_00660 [Leucobacter denitrificans]